MAKIDLFLKAAVATVFLIFQIFWLRWKDTSFQFLKWVSDRKNKKKLAALSSDLSLKKVLKNHVFVKKHFEKKFVRKSYNEQKCSEFRAGSFGKDENFAKLKLKSREKID